MTEVFGNCVSYNISVVSITKQVTKAIKLKEDSVRCCKTDHSNLLQRNDQKGPIIVYLDKSEWAIILFKMNFEKQSVVGIFQLAGYCGMYIL